VGLLHATRDQPYSSDHLSANKAPLVRAIKV
jgi:hypothetical protein